MISLRDTITEINTIANETEDMDTALCLLDLECQLDATLKAQDREWDMASIIIGFIAGCIFSVLMFATDVHADEVNVNGTSWHSDESYNYNNKNYGLGYTKDFNRNWQAKIGFYENSYYKQSLYALANARHVTKYVDFGVQFGFVTGYDDIESAPSAPPKVRNMNKFQFIVLPTVTFKATKEHSVTIGYMPSFSKDTFSFATAAYNYTF